MGAEINRWPKRSDRLRNHDQRTQEELRYAPSYPRHFDFHRRAVVCEGGDPTKAGSLSLENDHWDVGAWAFRPLR